ncbi:collagen alpha-1(I) chain-like [Canis lupus familiaris]|nr:collagen alpha-1(I) chain-like [Canis lupus familiaris]
MAAPVPGPLSLSGSAPASEASEASEASSEARWSGARRSLGALGLPSAGFGDHNGRAGPGRARRGPPSAAATDPCEARRQAPSGPPQAAGSPRETHRSAPAVGSTARATSRGQGPEGSRGPRPLARDGPSPAPTATGIKAWIRAHSGRSTGPSDSRRPARLPGPREGSQKRRAVGLRVTVTSLHRPSRVAFAPPARRRPLASPDPCKEGPGRPQLQRAIADALDCPGPPSRLPVRTPPPTPTECPLHEAYRPPRGFPSDHEAQVRTPSTSRREPPRTTKGARAARARKGPAPTQVDRPDGRWRGTGPRQGRATRASPSSAAGAGPGFAPGSPIRVRARAPRHPRAGPVTEAAAGVPCPGDRSALRDLSSRRVSASPPTLPTRLVKQEQASEPSPPCSSVSVSVSGPGRPGSSPLGRCPSSAGAAVAPGPKGRVDTAWISGAFREPDVCEEKGRRRRGGGGGGGATPEDARGLLVDAGRRLRPWGKGRLAFAVQYCHQAESPRRIREPSAELSLPRGGAPGVTWECGGGGDGRGRTGWSATEVRGPGSGGLGAWPVGPGKPQATARLGPLPGGHHVWAGLERGDTATRAGPGGAGPLAACPFPRELEQDPCGLWPFGRVPPAAPPTTRTGTWRDPHGNLEGCRHCCQVEAKPPPSLPLHPAPRASQASQLAPFPFLGHLLQRPTTALRASTVEERLGDSRPCIPKPTPAPELVIKGPAWSACQKRQAPRDGTANGPFGPGPAGTLGLHPRARPALEASGRRLRGSPTRSA